MSQAVEQLRALGVVEGGVLLVHTAFGKLRSAVASPLAFIAALRSAIGPRGTLVMPTMTDGASRFDPRTTPTSGMGITAELFWRQPGVVRSTHPGGSFAAEGPHAETICAPQPLSPPHGPDSPVGRVRDLDGQVLLAGVTHSENTTLHLAEAIAGVPYSIAHPTVVGDETILIAETDHCCTGFRQADAWLGALQRETTIGEARLRLVRSRDVVDVALARLRADPLVFLCPPENACEECDAARASITRVA